MKIQTDKAYAVITGDVVGSSKLAERERQALHSVMTSSSQELRSSFGECVPLDIDIFRGDGWQLLLTDAERSLRIGLLYRALIRIQMGSDVDTRMAIAVGTVDFLPGDRVSSGDGEAFRSSGSALETLARGARMTVAYPRHSGSRWVQALDTVVQLVDAIAINWTEKQAQAIAGSLRGLKQEEIANAWFQQPISQQAVAQHLDRASWNSVDKGLQFFEQELREPGF